MLEKFVFTAAIFALVTFGLIGWFWSSAPDREAPQTTSERISNGAASLMIKGIALGYRAKGNAAPTEETAPVLLQVNFRVEGDHSEFAKKMEGFAPFLSNVQGLVSKAWAADPITGKGNGTYVFQNKDFADMYVAEFLPHGMGRDPQVKDIEVTILPILKIPSRITRALPHASS